jgi:[NiFe] hydrogenase assembly HybE family chaperone
MSHEAPKTGDCPAGLIERTFSAIALGPMRDLPLNNPALRVEAVGFRPWEEHWLGALITPWTLSLLLLPAAPPIPVGTAAAWRFPSGTYEFLGGHREPLGHYQACSLFSPPAEFSSQDQARQMALACLEALFHTDDGTEGREAARLAGRPARYSRRAFLFGGTGQS